MAADRMPRPGATREKFATWLALTRSRAVDDRSVLAHVEREFRRCLECGIFIHRFGSALNAHLHFHCVALDGVVAPAVVGGVDFHPIPGAGRSP